MNKRFRRLKFYDVFLSALLFVFMVNLNLTPALAGDYTLPDTGQKKCYNASGEIPCPAAGEAFYGQDAQYGCSETDKSYQGNGDGTVKDLNTGLIWQQQDDGSKRDWQTAVNYCDGLSLAGFTDWRLPDDMELMTLVDYGKYNPAIDTSYFPNCQSASYWSGSGKADYSSTDYAWYVDFYTGCVNYTTKSSSSNVRCVRSGP